MKAFIIIILTLTSWNSFADTIIYQHNEDGTHTITFIGGNSENFSAGYTKQEVLEPYCDSPIIEHDPEITKNPTPRNYKKIIKQKKGINKKNIRRYGLSSRTVKKLKKFQSQLKNATEGEMLTRILLAGYPFQKLLGGASVDTMVEITTEDWLGYANGADNMSKYLRSQLRDYCIYEAISQASSSQDCKFWKNMSSVFNTTNN